MLDFDFLTPVNDKLIEAIQPMHYQTLGASMSIHSEALGVPDLNGIRIAVVGVLEDRLDETRSGDKFDFEDVRKSLYSLFPGNWHTKIADLGDIQPGAAVEDTYYALQTLVAELVKKDVLPIILGGSQDLIYAQYRAYDNLDQMVNLVNVDSRFDLGDADQTISNKSYVGKVVVTKPYNLFNYSNIGFQTYFNAQDEIDLMEKLYFDAYRLGEVTANISIVEPIMRNANLVGVDMGAVQGSRAENGFVSPNGFDGKEICALARYAGISDKVSSFGIYEFQKLKKSDFFAMLAAQMIWYFVEGVNFRTNENTISAKKEFIKYRVPIEDEILTFYKSPKSGRWWIEIPFTSPLNNKLERNTLLPCTQEDYLEACNQVIPERWYKAKRKNEIL